MADGRSGVRLSRRVPLHLRLVLGFVAAALMVLRDQSPGRTLKASSPLRRPPPSGSSNSPTTPATNRGLRSPFSRAELELALHRPRTALDLEGTLRRIAT